MLWISGELMNCELSDGDHGKAHADLLCLLLRWVDSIEVKLLSKPPFEKWGKQEVGGRLPDRSPTLRCFADKRYYYIAGDALRSREVE